jgi:hypothetical protein
MSSARAELNDLSTRSSEYNPTSALKNQTSSEDPLKSVDPNPASSAASLPPKINGQQQPADPPTPHPPKLPPRAYKKRKVHAIDSSSSRPVPPAEPLIPVDPTPSSRPDARTLNTIAPSPGSNNSSGNFVSAHPPPNGSARFSTQTNGLLGSRQATGLEVGHPVLQPSKNNTFSEKYFLNLLPLFFLSIIQAADLFVNNTSCNGG